MKKKVILILTLALWILGVKRVEAQCPFPTSPTYTASLSLTTSWQTTQAYSGDLYTINVNSGDTVYFSFCDVGASSSIDTYITLYNSGNSPINFADDECTAPNPGPSVLSFIAGYTGVYKVYFTHYDPIAPSDPCTGDGSTLLGDVAYIYTHQTIGTTTIVAGTPVGSIGNFFVQGVSPVNNSISIPDAPAGTYTIDYFATNGTYTTAYDSLKNVAVGGAWSLDMGSLPPGSLIRGYYYDNSHTQIGYSNDYVPTIIAKPQWLQTLGYVDNVNVVGNSVQMLGHFAFGTQNNSMPSNIPGLGSKSFNLNTPEITYNIDFDCSNGSASATTPNAKFSLNVLEQKSFSYNYPMSSLSSLSFDSNFNPQIIAEGTYTTSPFEIKWPLGKFYPLLPFTIPVVKIDGGLSINGELKGKMIYGYNTTYSAWGIDTARVTAKINATATLRVTADALIAKVSGALIAKGSIGGGLLYSDFPSSNLSPLFGMDLEIAGTVDYKLGRGIFTLAEGHLEKTFYQKTWGDQLRSPFERQVWDNVDAKGNYTRMTQANPYLQTPDFFAQPNLSANDSSLYSVWLDYSGNNTDILFSKLNYSSGYFSTPLTVASAEAISNPKVAILPSGNALISWTQNRYNSSNFNNSTMDLTNIFNGQDIWVTLYDKPTNSFATPIMLADDNSSLESGRAEGNANIIMGKGNYGLITWVVNNDATSENADVWYCTVTETGGGVTLGAPSQLINLTGTNRSINIAYSDSTNAIASWINDPDGLDSTLDNEVVFQEWNQTSQTWGSINTLISNNGSQSFDDLSLDFNGVYGAVAWTTTEYDANGNFAKGIYADAWNPNTQSWSPYSYALDTNYYFAQPKVSVNKNGYSALTYQAVRLFSDTLNPDVGQLNLYLNDAQNNPNTWTVNNGNPLLGDPAVYDWSLNTTYGDNNNFYIITQESDTITGNAPVNPPNGVRYGNNYLNLVFRALDVSPALVTDIEEPSTKSTLNKKESFDFNLYPNPVTAYTTIDYSLIGASNVSIEIFDLMGRSVAKVFEGKQGAGTYKATFEPNGLTNGVYLCKVTMNNQVAIKKMIITK
jgi:hypothetical protein